MLLATPSELLVRMWESASDEQQSPSPLQQEAEDAADVSAIDQGLGLLGGGASTTRGLSDKQRIMQVLATRPDDPARKFTLARNQEARAASAMTPRGAGRAS